MKTIGIIGCGNMGGALLYGFGAKLDKKDWSLAACGRSPEKLAPFASAGMQTGTEIAKTAAKADILIFAVKPYQMADALALAGRAIKENTIVVSIAAGFSLGSMRAAIGQKGILCRCMPTTTAMAGRGIFAFCFEDGAAKGVAVEITGLFRNLGYCLELPENKFTDFSALVGAGPAYVFAMMQGLAQAGVTLGFSHSQSREMICELFAGCAELAKMRDRHFSALRDEVCSPAGLTIAGVNSLDRAGLAGILVDAVLAAQGRGREMEG